LSESRWRNRIVGEGEQRASQFMAHPNNWRVHPQAQREAMRGALNEVGWVQRVVVNRRTGYLLDGHERVWQALQNGDAVVPYIEVDLDEEEEAYVLATLDPIGAMAIADTAKLDVLLHEVESSEAGVQQMLADLAEREGVMVWEPSETPEAQARATLAEQFVVPPFSVLDARQGYWQERKRAWINLGIKSELGRAGETGGSQYPASQIGVNGRFGRADLRAKKRVSPGGSPRPAADYHGQRGDGRGRTLGAIASNQATFLSPDYERSKAFKSQSALSALQRNDNGLLGKSQQARSHYSAKDFGTENNASEQTDTSIFDPVLCECAYTWWTGEGFRILDPFAGGSVRGIVAAYLGREYTGVELRAEQIEANETQAQALGLSPRWIHGDSANIRDIAPGEYDFIFSCPPYYDLEVYSDLAGELSAAPTYADFLDGYRHIVAESVALLRDDRFACFVVGDLRDKRGHYCNFVSDTIAAFRDAGCELYNEAILVTALGSLPIRVSSQFPSGRKLGKTHQNVLVFVKGDWRKAAQACGPMTPLSAEDLEK